MRASSGRGFTLLEVLVVMAIVAISLGAALQTTGVFTDNAQHLRDRTLALWVAENRATEYQLDRVFPPIGQQEGEAEMAGTVWAWRVEVSATEVPQLRRLDISVTHESGDPEEPLVSLVAFVGAPL